jgi:hypothetical protein
MSLLVLTAAPSLAAAQDDNGAVNKDGLKKTITFMKQAGSSDQEIADVVRRTGVDFKPTAADERELRDAGASDAVIGAVRGSYRGPAGPENNDKPVPDTKDEPQQPITIPTPKPTPSLEQKTSTRPEPRPRKPDKDFKFKVGDEVQADALMSSDPRSASYRKATIVGLDDANPADKAYLVQIDGEYEPKRYIIRPYTQHWIKAADKGDGEKQDKDFAFRVGDHIEVDTLKSSDPRSARYVPATIVELDNHNPADKAYIVEIEGQSGTFRYIIRPYTKHWVRAPEQ